MDHPKEVLSPKALTPSCRRTLPLPCVPARGMNGASPESEGSRLARGQPDRRPPSGERVAMRFFVIRATQNPPMMGGPDVRAGGPSVPCRGSAVAGEGEGSPV